MLTSPTNCIQQRGDTMNEKGVEVFRTTTWSPGAGCHGGCGVLAYIKDGKLVKVEGDPDHP